MKGTLVHMHMKGEVCFGKNQFKTTSFRSLFIIVFIGMTCEFKLLARWPSSRPKDGHFSEMGGFRRPVLGGNLRTSVRNVTKQCV